jgi:hypothetical protein
LDEHNIRCQSRDAVRELNFASDNSLFKSDSSDTESELPTVGSFTYNDYKNVIDFNIISVHINKEGSRDFVIVDFDWYGTRKTLYIHLINSQEVLMSKISVAHIMSITDMASLMKWIQWMGLSIGDLKLFTITLLRMTLFLWNGIAEPNNKSWIK